MAAVDSLIREATTDQSREILANVLTWALARFAVGYGTAWYAGDIVRRFGYHVCTLAEVSRAANAAAKAKQEGHEPH